MGKYRIMVQLCETVSIIAYKGLTDYASLLSIHWLEQALILHYQPSPHPHTWHLGGNSELCIIWYCCDKSCVVVCLQWGQSAIGGGWAFSSLNTMSVCETPTTDSMSIQSLPLYRSLHDRHTIIAWLLALTMNKAMCVWLCCIICYLYSLNSSQLFETHPIR